MHKTNPHFENAPNADQLKRLAASRFDIIKSVWPFPVIPGKLCMSRVWIGGDGAEAVFIQLGKLGAQQYFNRCLPTYRAFPGMVWCGPNEPSTSNLETCQVLCQFYLEWARLMHANGFLCAGLELAQGQPGGDAYERSTKTRVLGPAMVAMDYVTFHGYYCPPEVRADDIWHALRYRLILADLRAAGFTQKLKVVLDEDGIDRGVIDQAGGFRNIPITEQQYLPHIEKHDFELCKDPEVIGCTIYGFNPNPQWETFRIGPWLEDQLYNLAETAAVQPPEFKFDGRKLDQAGFKAYAESLRLAGTYDRVTIHHTAEPDEALWDQWGGWDYWKFSMRNTYIGYGWDAGPHVFIRKGELGIFTPLNTDGIGVTDNNLRNRHIEIVGNFDSRLPDEESLKSAVWAAAVLLKSAGLPITALSYHSAEKPEKSCPGDLFVANWQLFVGWVQLVLDGGLMTQAEIEKALGTEMQQHIVPLNPTAALEKAGAALGLLPAGTEFDLQVGNVWYRCQAYRAAGEREWQYGIYCVRGEWSNIHSFRRAN